MQLSFYLVISKYFLVSETKHTTSISDENRTFSLFSRFDNNVIYQFSDRTGTSILHKLWRMINIAFVSARVVSIPVAVTQNTKPGRIPVPVTAY